MEASEIREEESAGENVRYENRCHFSCSPDQPSMNLCYCFSEATMSIHHLFTVVGLKYLHTQYCEKLVTWQGTAALTYFPCSLFELLCDVR